MKGSCLRFNERGFFSGSRCKGVRPTKRSVGAHLVEKVGVFDCVMTYCELEVESYRRGVRRDRVV